MATTIRLTRMGRKKRPFYRLVVLDSRKRRDGAYLANLGYYNPFNDPYEIDLHQDEILSWLAKGATLSETARSLLKAEGVLFKYSLVKQGLADAEVEQRMTEWRDAAATRRDNKVEAAESRKAAVRQDREDRENAAKAKAAEAVAEAKAAEEKAAAEAAAKAEAEAAEKAEAEAAEKAEAEAAAKAEAAPAEEAAAEKPAADEDAEKKKDADVDGEG